MKQAFVFILAAFLGECNFAIGQCGTTGTTLTIESEADLLLVENCDSVFGSLLVNAPDLSTLQGMESIVYIEEDFLLDGNLSLLTFQGMDNLGYVGGDVRLTSNFTMINLNGAPLLDSIGGDLYFEANLGLDDMIGMEDLIYLGGDLELVDGNQQSLDGLENLITIGGDIRFGNDMDALQNIAGLSGLQSVGGSLFLNELPFTTINGLENLQNVGGNLELKDNVLISNTNALINLEEISGDLIIEGNFSLTQVDSLYHLMTVGGDVRIQSNGALNGCCGLLPLLPSSGPQIGGDLVLEGNGSSCNDEDQIILDCSVGMNEVVSDDQLLLSNALQNVFHDRVQVTEYDMIGKVVRTKSLEVGEEYVTSGSGICIVVATGRGLTQVIRYVVPSASK